MRRNHLPLLAALWFTRAWTTALIGVLATSPWTWVDTSRCRTGGPRRGRKARPL